MRRNACIVVCLAAALFQAGCGRTAPAEAPEPPAAAAITVSAAELPAAEADLEGLLRLLDRAGEQQPHTAGSSLRTAALAGETLRWLSENPVPPGTAGRAALRWGADKGISERRRAGRAFHLLNEAVGRMEGEDLRALLEDAGCRLPENCPGVDEYARLTEELFRALTPEIFKNPGENMNISS